MPGANALLPLLSFLLPRRSGHGDHPRDRPRAVRAGAERRAGGAPGERGPVDGHPRESVPVLGAHGWPVRGVLETLRPDPPRAPAADCRLLQRRLLQLREQGPCRRPDPRGRRRAHLPAPRLRALRDREGPLRRLDRRRGPPAGLERQDGGVLGRRAPQRHARGPPGRPLERWVVWLLPELHVGRHVRLSGECMLRAAPGGAED